MSAHWSFPEDYPESDKVASVSDAAFRVFTTMVLQADDEGRGRASARRWGARSNVRGDASEAFASLVAAGLVVVYQHGGRDWFFLPGRFQHNDSKRWWAMSEIPLPPDELLLRHPEYLAGLASVTTKGRRAIELGKSETRRYPRLWELLASAGECWRVLADAGLPHIDVDVDIEEDSSSSSSSCKETQCRGGTLPRARAAAKSAPPRPAGVLFARFPLELDPSRPEIGEDFWPEVDRLAPPTGNQLAFLRHLTIDASAKTGRRVTVAEAAAAVGTRTLAKATFTAIKDHLKALARASPTHPRDVTEFNRRSLDEYLKAGGNSDEN